MCVFCECAHVRTSQSCILFIPPTLGDCRMIFATALGSIWRSFLSSVSALNPNPLTESGGDLLVPSFCWTHFEPFWTTGFFRATWPSPLKWLAALWELLNGRPIPRTAFPISAVWRTWVESQRLKQLTDSIRSLKIIDKIAKREHWR
jgi:hypothetical protein